MHSMRPATPASFITNAAAPASARRIRSARVRYDVCTTTTGGRLSATSDRTRAGTVGAAESGVADNDIGRELSRERYRLRRRDGFARDDDALHLRQAADERRAGLVVVVDDQHRNVARPAHQSLGLGGHFAIVRQHGGAS